MPLEIGTPREDDVSAISDLHLRAMDANILLHAQFPNAPSLQYLHGWLDRDTVQHLKDNDKGISVSRDLETQKIVSFVKWLVHRDESGDTEPTVDDEPWPETCRKEYLDSYSEITQNVRKEVMGRSSYYHVTFLCTDPGHGGRGAASALLRKVQDSAAAENMPVVLESTMEAVAFYKKFGFKVAKGLGMMLPPRGSDKPTELYEEKSMVWRA